MGRPKCKWVYFMVQLSVKLSGHDLWRHCCELRNSSVCPQFSLVADQNRNKHRHRQGSRQGCRRPCSFPPKPTFPNFWRQGQIDPAHMGFLLGSLFLTSASFRVYLRDKAARKMKRQSSMHPIGYRPICPIFIRCDTFGLHSMKWWYYSCSHYACTKSLTLGPSWTMLLRSVPALPCPALLRSLLFDPVHWICT